MSKDRLKAFSLLFWLSLVPAATAWMSKITSRQPR